MPKTPEQKERNRLNAARRRRENPEREAEISKRAWENGGRERAAERNRRKKASDFFGYRVQFIRRHNRAITADDLRTLWEAQDGRCALTGEPLQMIADRGVGPELDHIVPITRGGTSELSNLRWVTHRVNRAKGNLTDEEFFALCRSVVG
jgi:5-methylcytosine-specific restriction endonuclease McrA